jgi:uncharacterized protein YndB with AHSA1/START domain
MPGMPMKRETKRAKPAKVKSPAAKSETGATGTIEQSLLVNASPVEVFRALAEPLRHSAFTGARATGVARPGGRFTAFDGYIEGTYLVVVPGKRLAMRWRTRAFPKGATPSHLELVFKAEGGGTRLTLVQRDVPASQIEKYRSGWIANYWDPLRDWFDAR